MSNSIRVVDIQNELRLLRTVLGDSESLAGLILGSVDESAFAHRPVLKTWKHVMTVIKDVGERPSWSSVLRDPLLPSSIRQNLKSFNGKPFSSRRQVQGGLDIVRKYRKIRQLADVATKIKEGLGAEEIDIDDLEVKVGDALMGARARVDESRNIIHIGTGNNSSKVVREMLYGEKPPVMPTGVAPFDKVNGGIPYGGFFLAAANSGGGKSALAANLLLHTTVKVGLDCCLVTLEMDHAGMFARFSGIRTGIDVTRIQSKQLNDKEKEVVERDYTRMVRRLKKNGNRLTVFAPESDMTIEEIFFLLKVYNYKFIMIDYASLVKPSDDSEAQWQQLQSMTRICKRWAHANNMVVGLLAQLSDDGNVRYSRAMKENASNMWTWIAPDEYEPSSVIEVHQQKARNQKAFTFTIHSNNETMAWTYPEDNPLGDKESSDSLNGSDKESEEKSDYVTDINEESDSED